MDYRELLLKYIQHVRDLAKRDFILGGEIYKTHRDFSDGELAELEALSLVAREME